jgi:RimJ/RimL family protein N-acetyltransferase
MINLQPVTLTGQHICLEPLSESHIPELIIAGSDISIGWPSTWPSNQYHPDVMEKYIRNMLELHVSGKRIHYAVKHLPNSRIIGMTSYHSFREDHCRLEIGGTWFIVEFQRTPINTECKYLMLKHAFEEFHCIRVEFKVDEDNTRSINAVKRIGAVQEAVLRNNYIVEGKYFDMNMYSIIIEECPRVKLKLEQMLSR